MIHVRNMLARLGLHLSTRKGDEVFAARLCGDCGGKIPYLWVDCGRAS